MSPAPAVLVAEAEPVHYLPLLTTGVALVFASRLWARHRERRSGPHLAWWTAGVLTYGLGTALESVITLAGNGPFLNRAWYAAGAVLGAYPLAQGSIYLLLPRRAAHALTAVSLPAVAALCVLCLACPIDPALLEAHRPSVAAMDCPRVRAAVPVVNSYAALFLVGGALWSCALFAFRRPRGPGAGQRALGNGLIAAGAILPGVGGYMARGGAVEALYVTELAGLLLIWAGYAACVREVPRGPAP